MESLCRVCRRDVGTFIPIRNHWRDVKIAEMIAKTCPIDVSVDDNFPQQLCNTCLEAVTNAYQLQLTSLESEEFFKSLLSIGYEEHEVSIKKEVVEALVKTEDPMKEGGFHALDWLAEDQNVDEQHQQEEYNTLTSVKTEMIISGDSSEDIQDIPRRRKNKRKHRFSNFDESEDDLEKYYTLDNMIQEFTCDLCKYATTVKSKLYSHMHIQHGKEKSASRKYTTITEGTRMFNLKCVKCDKTFSNKKIFRQHKLEHENLYRELEPNEITIDFNCVICNDEHDNEAELNKHLPIHLKLFVGDRIKCFQCPIKFSTFDEMIQHTKYHLLPKTHICTQCQKKLPFDDKIYNHIQTHIKKKEYTYEKVKQQNCICPTCGKTLSCETNLKTHLRDVHAGDELKRFECKLCLRKFPNKTKLNRHSAIHSKDRPYVCELCSSAFKLREGLSKHMKRHNGTYAKPHQCSVCSLKFDSRDRLSIHMMGHDGIKPHACQYCDRAYTLKSDLVKHLQKNHLGNAIYRCTFIDCTEAFRLKVELSEHYRDHAKK